MRYLSLSFFICLCAIDIQASVVITGHVRNAVSRVIEFEIDNRYLDNSKSRVEVRLDDQDFFVVDLDLLEPRTVTMIYARNSTEIFLDPGYEVNVEFDANTFEFSMQFTGSGGPNNEFLKNFRKTFHKETNPFKLTGYRKGLVHYQVENSLDTKMRTLSQTNFYREMLTEKDKMLGELDSHQKSYRDLTPGFHNYMWAEITYEWAYKLLVYGHIYGNLHNITSNYWDFFYEAPLNNAEALVNPLFRRCLLGYVNFRFAESGIEGNEYSGQFNLAKALYADECLFFVQSHLLAKGLPKGNFETLIPAYKEFMEHNTYAGFDSKVVEAFYTANKYAVGSPAPDFTMKDINGQPVSLSDFRGKIVYLDFWASWCRPCIAKIEMVKSVARHLNRDDVVFVHLSLERSEERWRDQLSFRNIEGVNVFIPEGMESQLIKEYNVKAIPEYFIIDPYGNFAIKPNKVDAITLTAHLENMLSQY